jgi:hypothetical protein
MVNSALWTQQSQTFTHHRGSARREKVKIPLIFGRFPEEFYQK